MASERISPALVRLRTGVITADGLDDEFCEDVHYACRRRCG